MMRVDAIYDSRVPHPANPISPSCTEVKMKVMGRRLFHLSPSQPWKYPIIKIVIMTLQKRNFFIQKCLTHALLA